MENAKDPLGRMSVGVCVRVCINTVTMCSGVCMNVEYLIKGNVRVHYVSTRQHNTTQTQTSFVGPGHRLAPCHTWRSRRIETRK